MMARILPLVLALCWAAPLGHAQLLVTKVTAATVADSTLSPGDTLAINFQLAEGTSPAAQVHFVFNSGLAASTTNPATGVATGLVTRYSANGNYTLLSITVIDTFGHVLQYGSDGRLISPKAGIAPASGPAPTYANVAFSVSGAGETLIAPSIAAITRLSPDPLTAGAPASFRITHTAGSGIAAPKFTLLLDAPDHSSVSGSATLGDTGIITLESTTDWLNGVYHVLSSTIADEYSSRSHTGSDGSGVINSSLDFTVAGGIAAVTYPTLGSATKTAGTILIPGQSIPIAFTATPGTSPVASVEFGYEDPAGFLIFVRSTDAGTGAVSRIIGPDWLNGPYQLNSIIIRDRMGHQTTYQRNQARVRNPSGQRDTHAFDFTALDFTVTGGVQILPYVVTQPANLTLQPQQQGSLTVEADTIKAFPPSFQWYVGASGNTSLPVSTGGNSATLSLSPQASVTSYWVRVTTAAGSVDSATAMVTVNYPSDFPTITTQPVSQSRTVGNSLSAYAVVVGPGPLTYQWYREGAPITGATSSMIAFHQAKQSDSGTYWVIVSNASGSVTSDSVVLTAVDQPVILVHPTSQAAVFGSAVTFTVTATGGDLQYSWSLNGSSFGPVVGDGTSTITIPYVRLDHAGAIRVRAQNSSGFIVSNPATLTVTPLDFSGVYFGTFASGGDWALHWRPDNTASYIAHLARRQSVIVAKLKVYPTGFFEARGTEFRPVATRSMSIASAEGPSVNTHENEESVFSVTGEIAADRTVTGLLIGLGESFFGSHTTGDSPYAGSYTANALGSGSGQAFAIVGGEGQAMAITASPTATDSAIGAVTAPGLLTTTTTSGANLSLSINPTTQTFSASLIPVGSPTPVNYAGLPDTLTPDGHLSNLSVRAATDSAKTLIVGFVVEGAAKPMLVRAAGPALNAYGLTGVTDPFLRLYDGGAFVTSNEDWPSALATTFATLGAFPFAAASKDSALQQSLSGAHTAQATATNSGQILVEAYDAGPNDTRKLTNLSARFQVGTGDNILIAGFVLAGSGTRQVLVRAVGPTLLDYGVPGVLADPQFAVFDGATVLASNNDWSASLASTFTTLGAFALDAGSKDAALVVTLQAGKPYTVQVSGVGNTTGEALVELYLVP